MNEALRDWVTNVGDTLLLDRLGRRPASVSVARARPPVRDRPRSARAGDRRRPVRCRRARRVRRRRLERRGAVRADDRHGALLRRRSRGRRHRDRSPRRDARCRRGRRAARQQELRACRPATVRSRTRTRSALASIIPASGPSTRIGRTPARSRTSRAATPRRSPRSNGSRAAKASSARSRPRTHSRALGEVARAVNGGVVIVGLSGRGDKDMTTIAANRGGA